MPDSFNPILNSPYEEPTRHYFTFEDGTLDYEDIRKGRRPFSLAVNPVPIKQSQQQQIAFEEEQKQKQANLINDIRKEIGIWRDAKYPGVTRVTKELLNFWFTPLRNRRLFFAQQEALEVTIWLNEVAEKSNKGQFILNALKAGQIVDEQNPDLNIPRIAFKIATGGGKTVVMAMQILYHFYNRMEYRNDTRFADYFLILTPGITIKDRLGVLYVDVESKFDPQDYYNQRDLVPDKMKQNLNLLNKRIIITNRHSLERRTFKGNKRTPFDGKKDANGIVQDAKEDYDLVLRRLLKNFKKDTRLLILNDEGHHCYLPKGKTKDNDDKKENERAAVWFSGIVEISKRYKVKNIYDLSATPYYLKGSGYREYSLFPWVVSDFGLIEAMESGLVKIPFMPERDTTQQLDEPVLKNLYEHISADLPKKSKENQALGDAPRLPPLLLSALDQFYSHYEIEYERVAEVNSLINIQNPPVFIIVCNNTSLSYEVFRHIAGYKKTENINVAGLLPLLSNFDSQTHMPLPKPPTLLIDSNALENSEQIDDSFRNVFKTEVDKFKNEYRRFHPDKSVENLDDSDLLREVVNTVGKANSLGSHIRCVVSVSMLTEGWDANTVTHIMGIRAFGSQLLCEQVVGRALRRSSYDIATKGPDKGKFAPEYAHVIGVPFNFFRGGVTVSPNPPKPGTIIKTLKERSKFIIHFPNVKGYRIESENDELAVDFSHVESYKIDGTRIPKKTELEMPFGDEVRTLEITQAKNVRRQELEYTITKYMMQHFYTDYTTNRKFQYFPRILEIVRLWLDTKVVCLGDAFTNMLIYYDVKSICNHIIRGINPQKKDSTNVIPIMHSYSPVKSTEFVHGSTTREVYKTRKSHVNYVVADTDTWEQIAAKTLEEMPEVLAYVKNAFLGFTIPYIKEDNSEGLYYPDFIARIKTKKQGVVNLIIEVTGYQREDKEKKKYFTNQRWIPAVNSIRGKYPEIKDKWDFVEITDIKTIKNVLTEYVER